MTKRFLLILGVFLWTLPLVAASGFTVGSYNCGGLSDHYDYIRAAVNESIMQQRYAEEPEQMERLKEAEIEACQQNLYTLLGCDGEEPWDGSDYHALTMAPNQEGSPNQKWYALSQKMLSPWQERPVVIHDAKVRKRLEDHVTHLTGSPDELTLARQIMAKQIFKNELTFDILALQETQYLDKTLFPEKYEVILEGDNGLAWNKERFLLVKKVAVLGHYALMVQLNDLDTNEEILVASGHLAGCNPYRGGDSEKGDAQLKEILELFDAIPAHVNVLAMDANVTATHPRLQLLNEYGFMVDSNIEPTCTNPYTLLDGRIDWIAMRSGWIFSGLVNLPIQGVGLNSLETNMSDHKPIAALIMTNFLEDQSKKDVSTIKYICHNRSEGEYTLILENGMILNSYQEEYTFSRFEGQLQEGERIEYIFTESNLHPNLDRVDFWKEGTKEKYSACYHGKTDFQESHLKALGGDFLLIDDHTLYLEYSSYNTRLSDWNVDERLIFGWRGEDFEYPTIINLDRQETTRARPLTYHKTVNYPWLYLGDGEKMEIVFEKGWTRLDGRQMEEPSLIFVIDRAMNYNANWNILDLPPDQIEKIQGKPFAIAFHSGKATYVTLSL